MLKILFWLLVKSYHIILPEIGDNPRRYVFGHFFYFRAYNIVDLFQICSET